jgi:hypothetical protein
MRFYLAALAVAAGFCPSRAPAQSAAPLDSAQVRLWKEDLAFLRAEMPRRHHNLFHTMSRPQLDSALHSIEARLPQLARYQVIVELQKLAAMIGDGHSNVGPWRDSLIAFQTLPVALYWFPEGLVIRAADSAHRSLIGGKVTRIGALPVDSAIARVSPLISRDNEMGPRAYTPFFLVMPEILHAVGLTDRPAEATLAVEKNGRTTEVRLKAAGKFPMLTGEADRSWVYRPGFVDARESAPATLWLSDPLNYYWYRYLPDAKTLYLQINTIQHKPADSLSSFMRRAIAAADSGGAQRLVLDLRLNGGGNGSLNKHIMLPIIKSRYDSAGRFSVLTGRRTWSAAQMLVTELEKYTTATFVGEPTASKANHFGDSYRIVLPNSRITFRVSTRWHQYRDQLDKRSMIPPAIPAALTFADYAAGRDPVLEAALRR